MYLLTDNVYYLSREKLFFLYINLFKWALIGKVPLNIKVRNCVMPLTCEEEARKAISFKEFRWSAMSMKNDLFLMSFNLALYLSAMEPHLYLASSLCQMSKFVLVWLFKWFAQISNGKNRLSLLGYQTCQVIGGWILLHRRWVHCSKTLKVAKAKVHLTKICVALCHSLQDKNLLKHCT